MKHFSTVKRPICLLLILAMLLGVMPASVFASDDAENIEAALQQVLSEAAQEAGQYTDETESEEKTAPSDAESTAKSAPSDAESTAKPAPSDAESTAKPASEAAESEEITEESAEAPAMENTVADEVRYPEFFAKTRSNGVEIVVSAPDGVFPEDARLKVRTVGESNEYAKAIGKAVDVCREDDRTVAEAYVFDIKVVDSTGRELQPNTVSGNVSVKFSVAQADNANLTTDVYHITDVDGNEMTAHALDTDVEGREVSVETDGFSYYVIELSYENITYRVTNYDELTMEAFLAAIGLVVGEDEEVLNITSSNTAVLSISTNDDDETVLIPEGRGTSLVTVTIGEDYDTAVVYEANFSIATREDKVISGDPSAEPTKGKQTVTLEEYTKPVEFTLTTDVDEIDDLEFDTSIDYEYFMMQIYQLQAELYYGHEFTYNGNTAWYTDFNDSDEYQGSPVETIYETGEAGLQLMPFIAFIGADEDPEIVVDFKNGKMLYSPSNLSVKNQYYFACYAQYRKMYTSYGLMEDHDLALCDEKDLKVVYGYAICDAQGDCGYTVLAESDPFRYKADGLAVSYDNYYLFTLQGNEISLTDDMSVVGPNGPYTINVLNADTIDWNNPAEGTYQTAYGINNETTSFSYYNLQYEITDKDGEVVYECSRYLILVDQVSACFRSGESMYYSSYGTNEAYVITDAQVAAECNAAVQSQGYSYYEGTIHYFTETDNITEELKSHFYGVLWGDYIFKLDPSCIELVDDGGYESPWEWDAEDMEDEEELFAKEFRLVYEVTNPNTDSEPCQVEVSVYLMRPVENFSISYEFENGAEECGVSAATYAADGEVILPCERTLPDTEVGDTDFWLWQYLNYINGESCYETCLDGESDFALNISTVYGHTIPGMEAAGTRQENLFCKEGYFDQDGKLVLDKDTVSGSLGYKVSGNLDINRVGSYRIEIRPIADGMLMEDLVITFIGKVVPKRTAEVTIANDKNLNIYKPYNGVYTAAELKTQLLGTTSAKDEYGNDLEIEVSLKNTSGEAVSLEAAAAGMAEGDTYTVTYTSTHTKDLTAFAQVSHTVTVVESDLDFEGIDALTVAVETIKDFDHALRGGVKAVTESGQSIAFTYATDYVKGAASGNYTITYTAVHPGTGKTYTGERVLHVVGEDLGSSTLSFTLEDTSATQHPGLPGQNPENFILGTASQDAFTFTISYSKGSAEEPSVEVYIPYGFELQQAGYTPTGYTATLTGSYASKEGSVLTLVPGLATTNIIDDITLVPRLDILYPALKEGYNEYVFSAQSFDGGAPSGVCTSAGYTFTARDEFCEEDAMTVTAGTQEFTVGQLFGNYMFTSSYSGSAAYKVTVTKSAGKLPDPDWKLNFTIPEELRLKGNDPFYLSFLDENDEVIAGTSYVTAVYNTDGSMTVPLYGNTRFQFSKIDGNMTYMDAVRQASSVVLSIHFTTGSGNSSIKLNLPGDAQPAGKGVANEGVMTGSEVSFFNGTDTPAAAADAIGVRLVNGTSTLEPAAGATTIHVESYVGAPSKDYVSTGFSEISAGGDGIQVSALVLDNLAGSGTAQNNWNIYKNLEVTVEYPYEYSPVAPYYYNSNYYYYYDVYYMVSTPGEDGTPVAVPGKENLKASMAERYNSATSRYYIKAFDIDEANNEYVSSVTVKYKGNYSTILNNWSSYNYAMETRVYNSIPFPLFQTRASYVKADGSVIEEPYTVSFSTYAKDDRYTTAVTTQQVRIIPTNEEMKVCAVDLSESSYSEATLGTVNSTWDEYGIAVSFFTKTSTKKYTNAKLVITGPAVRIANFNNYWFDDLSTSSAPKVVGYSTSDKASEGPWAEGEEDLWITGTEATKAAARGFTNVKNQAGEQIPVTGVIVDISGFTYSGSSYSGGDYSYFYIDSYGLNSATPFFDDLTKEDLETNGYSILDYSVSFHADNGDAVIASVNGKTAPISAGRFISSITQKNSNYVLNPLAGSSERYDVSTMKLIDVNHGTTQRFSWENYLGHHGSFKTVFESDGTAAGDALMSLAEGLFCSDYRTRILSVDYQTVTADGTAKKKTTYFTGYDEYVSSRNEYHRFYYDADNNSTYCCYAPFNLSAGEYVTKVTVNWTNFSDYYDGFSGVPSVSLLRVSAVPEKTRTGYSITAGEQLPCKVTSSYVTGDGAQRTFVLNGVSARMCGVLNKTIEYYDAEEYLPLATPKKGTSFAVQLQNDFSFSDTSVRLGDTRCYPWLTDSKSYNSMTGLVNHNGDKNNNKLRYTVYYRINKGFEYVAGSMSCNGGAVVSYYPETFTDGSGLLKVVYNGYRLSGSDTATIKLRSTFDVKHENIAPILGAWLDASYDLTNSQAERNYSIVYGSSAVVLDAAITAKLGLPADTKAMFCNLSDVVFPDRADADMFYYTVTAAASNGSFSKAEQGTALKATADSSFGIAGELINTASDCSTDWDIYIPVPTAGKTVSVLENTGLTESDASEFSLKLKEAVTAEGGTITYTTAAEPAFNALTGVNGGEDGEDYVSADEITDWSEVTAIHIYVPEVTKAATRKIKVTFSDVEKTAVGTLNAYTTAYYNYRTGDGRMLFGTGGISSKYPYGTTSLSTFVLDDYYITGTVWDDLDKDGAMVGEPGVAGITVKAVTGSGDEIEALDSAEITATAVTDEDGIYTLAVPQPGTYKLIVPRVGIYDITKADKDAAAMVKSWANDNGETDLITITCDSASIGEDEVIVNAGILADMNFGVICVDIDAGDAFYGINQGPVTMDTLTSLFHASWKDRSGNPGAVTIDADCLTLINSMIAQRNPGAVAVTLRHTAEDATGMSVVKTVYLKLRDSSSEVPAGGEKKEYLAATSFQYPVSGELTASNARKMAFAEALDWEGNAYKTSKITVDAAQLAVINAAIEEGEYDEAGYALTFTTEGNAAEGVEPVSLTVTVTLEGSITKKGKIGTTDYLTIENFTYERSEGTLTAAEVIALSHVSGLDKRGSSIETFSVDAESLAKLNNAINNRKPGVYRVAISSTGADAVSIKTTVTLTDTFTVAFGKNGGSGAMNSVTVRYGQPLTVDANTFQREGYTYAGWNSNAAGDAAYTDEATLTASVVNRLYAMATDPDRDGVYTATLYAIWKKIPGTGRINVSVSSGNLIGSRDVLIDIYQGGVSVTEAINGTFSKTEPYSGAFTALDQGTYELKMTVGQTVQTKTITLAKGATASAAFTFKAETVYTVNYNAGEGSLPAETKAMVRQIAGYTYTLPECIPANGNRVFVGWKTEDGTLYGKGAAVTGLYDGEENDVVMNLTAVYRDRVYYVSFETGSGQLPAGAEIPEVWHCGQTYTIPGCETADSGLEFNGWKDAEGHLFTAGQEIANIYAGDKDGASVKLTAVWGYCLNLVKEDAQFAGGYTEPQTWISGDKYVLPTLVSSDEELVFAGWRAEDGSLYKAGSNAVNLYNTDEDGNGATLTAVWKNKTYTVSFDAGEGSCPVSAKNLAKGQIFGKLPVPVLDGADFDGWFTAASGGTEITSETIFDKTQTQLFARWAKTTYSAIINGTEAVVPSFGEDYTFSADETLDVKVTIGGKEYTPINNGDGTYTIPGSDIKGEIVIETVPADADYATLTYMFEGKAIGTVKALKSGKYPVVALPEVDGYDVTGWFDAQTSGKLVRGIVETTGVNVLYAYKTPHTFQVSFDGDESTCEFGDEVVFEAPAPREGYEFLGWQIEGGAFVPYNGGEFVSFPMIAEDAVVTSCWQKVGALVVTVLDELGAPVNGATVKVTQGNLVLDGSGITDENGRAVFNDLPYGSYNIVVVSRISADETVVTTSGKDITEETNTLTMSVPLFKLNTKVDSDDYNVTSEYLEMAISDAEKAEIRNTTASDKEVVLVLKATRLDDASAEDAALKDSMNTFVEENADAQVHQRLIEYVDLTVHQRITTTETGMEPQTSETTVPETNEYQVISIEITPQMYAALAAVNGTPENIVVYRSHEGVVSAMTKGEDLKGECYWIKNVAGINYIVIKAKYFSVYAFGVQDEAVEYTEEKPIVIKKRSDKKETAEVTTGVENWLITDSHFAYISGYTDGTVRPDGNISRAETAMIFYKLLKNKDIEENASFSDVADGQWYTTAVRTLASLGIISGYTDGTFRPAEKITRAEFAAISMKFAQMNDCTASFTDVASTFWAEKYIAAAATYGWISGYTDGSFRPFGDITRAEVASIINRMLCRRADEDYIQMHFGSLRQFADLQDRSKWYYGDMVEATNAHEYVATTGGESWN